MWSHLLLKCTSIISSEEHITLLNVEIVAIQILNYIYFILKQGITKAQLGGWHGVQLVELEKMNKYIKSTFWHSLLQTSLQINQV